MKKFQNQENNNNWFLKEEYLKIRRAFSIKKFFLNLEICLKNKKNCICQKIFLVTRNTILFLDHLSQA